MRNWDLDQRDLVAPGSSLCLLAVSFPCLWNYSRFAQGCKSGCLCTAGQAVPTHPQRWIVPVPRNQQIKGIFLKLFFPAAIKEKREDKQLISEKSGLLKFSQPSCRIKAMGIPAELGQLWGNSSCFGHSGSVVLPGRIQMSWHSSQCARGTQSWGWPALPRQPVPNRSKSLWYHQCWEPRGWDLLFVMSIFPCLCKAHWDELEGWL